MHCGHQFAILATMRQKEYVILDEEQASFCRVHRDPTLEYAGGTTCCGPVAGDG
jgi:hypothetical protein